jgi:hypothetical protein
MHTPASNWATPRGFLGFGLGSVIMYPQVEVEVEVEIKVKVKVEVKV